MRAQKLNSGFLARLVVLIYLVSRFMTNVHLHVGMFNLNSFWHYYEFCLGVSVDYAL